MLSTILGGNEYLLGDRPSTYDCTVYGFLEALLCFPNDSEVQRHAKTLTNLVAYRERVRGRYFADLPAPG